MRDSRNLQRYGKMVKTVEILSSNKNRRKEILSENVTQESFNNYSVKTQKFTKVTVGTSVILKTASYTVL